jgi:hypothetical protein
MQNSEFRMQNSEFAVRLVSAFCILHSAFALGCAGLRPGGDREPGLSTSRSAVQPASYDDRDDEQKGLSWSDLHIDNWGKTTKKLTGQGPDRE